LKLVIDASVAVKWIFPDLLVEPHADRAAAVLRAVRDGTVEVLQPLHWLVEVMAVVARIAPDIRIPALNLLDALELEICDDVSILGRGAALAAELDHHLFDTLYHAVALEREATLLTADARYARKARRTGRVWLLGEPTPVPGLD